MLTIDVIYEPTTRQISLPSSSDFYGGATIDSNSVAISVTGIDTSDFTSDLTVRIDFAVDILVCGNKVTRPFLILNYVDDAWRGVIAVDILRAASRLKKLPFQLVLRDGNITINSRNTLTLGVNRAIDAMGTLWKAYTPYIMLRDDTWQWLPNFTYGEGAVVTYEGRIFVSLQNENIDHPPLLPDDIAEGQEDLWWKMNVGEQGPQGPPGEVVDGRDMVVRYIGNGVDTEYVVQHNFGTSKLIYSMQANGKFVDADVFANPDDPDDNSVIVRFAYPPATNGVIMTFYSGFATKVYDVLPAEGEYIGELIYYTADRSIRYWDGEIWEPLAQYRELEFHLKDYNNPHNVNKYQVDLGNVENLAPKDLPVSTATQEALDAEANEREDADANLQRALDAEILRSTNAENALGEQLDIERTERATTDTEIQNRISTEVTRLDGVDSELRTSIEKVANDLSAEVARSTAEDEALTDALAQETQARTAADTALRTDLDGTVKAVAYNDVHATLTFTKVDGTIVPIELGDLSEEHFEVQTVADLVTLNKAERGDTATTTVDGKWYKLYGAYNDPGAWMLMSSFRYAYSLANDGTGLVLKDADGVGLSTVVMDTTVKNGSVAPVTSGAVFTSVSAESSARAQAIAEEAQTRSTADDAITATVTAHTGNTSNPHVVTKTQIGLGNVDDTSDMNKPISTATQGALDLKANKSTLDAHIGNTSNPHTVTKAQVGLGLADNTSDMDKPISTATQSALDLKADKSVLDAHTGNTSNPHAVTKVQVGLGNVDDTSDMDKPISTATQGALDALTTAVNNAQATADSKLSKSGGTLTGGLIIQRGAREALYINNPSRTMSTGAESYLSTILFTDMLGAECTILSSSSSSITVGESAAGVTTSSITSRAKTPNNTDVSATLSIIAGGDGSSYVTVPTPPASANSTEVITAYWLTHHAPVIRTTGDQTRSGTFTMKLPGGQAVNNSAGLSLTDADETQNVVSSPALDRLFPALVFKDGADNTLGGLRVKHNADGTVQLMCSLRNSDGSFKDVVLATSDVIA